MTLILHYFFAVLPAEIFVFQFTLNEEDFTTDLNDDTSPAFQELASSIETLVCQHFHLFFYFFSWSAHDIIKPVISIRFFIVYVRIIIKQRHARKKIAHA